MKVSLIAAVTVDGFIGLDSAQPATAWTTTADTKYFVQKTKELGTVIMGRKTFDTFKKPLKDRRLIISTSAPELIKVDGVEATDEQPIELVDRLKVEGVSTVAIAGGATIYRQYMQAGLVTDLYITIVPKIFGTGIRFFDNLIDQNLLFIDSALLEDNQTILLHYKTK